MRGRGEGRSQGWGKGRGMQTMTLAIIFRSKRRRWRCTASSRIASGSDREDCCWREDGPWFAWRRGNSTGPSPPYRRPWHPSATSTIWHQYDINMTSIWHQYDINMTLLWGQPTMGHPNDIQMTSKWRQYDINMTPAPGWTIQMTLIDGQEWKMGDYLTVGGSYLWIVDHRHEIGLLIGSGGDQHQPADTDEDHHNAHSVTGHLVVLVEYCRCCIAVGAR